MPNYFVVTLCDIFQQFNGREISACRISAKQKLHRSPTHFKKAVQNYIISQIAA
jgi:hypothetical protein